jgi:3-deoxy-D-manno-octulosonic-acid transferase
VSHFNSAVIFGPNMQNFKEIKEKILTTKSGIQVKNSKQLADKIAYFLKNETKRKKIIKNFKKLQILEAKKSSLLIQNIYRKL